MKHKHAALISQFANMVEAGHPIDKLVQVKFFKNGEFTWVADYHPRWSENNEYRVALAFVEGKPVFSKDCLFDKDGNEWIVLYPNAAQQKSGNKTSFYGIHTLSWNKPEEKKQFKIGDDCICQEFKVFGLGKIGGKCKITSAEHNAKIIFPNGFTCSVDYCFLTHAQETKYGEKKPSSTFDSCPRKDPDTDCLDSGCGIITWLFCPHAHEKRVNAKTEEKKPSFDDVMNMVDNNQCVGLLFNSNGVDYMLNSFRIDSVKNIEEFSIVRIRRTA